MRTEYTSFDIKKLQSSWQIFDAMVHLRPIVNEPEYSRMVLLMNTLLDEVGDKEDHPLSGLLDLVGDLVSNYEQQYHAIEQSEPKEMLRFLMNERGLKQSDLSEIIPQSNLSAVLAGKRKISASLASKLGKFFGVSPVIFISE